MNHYIRLDGDKIIKGFSSAFEQPIKGDILIAKNADRHFILNDVINPSLTDDQGIPLYKYVSGKIEVRTKVEIDADIANIPAPAPSETEKLRAEVDAVKAILVEKAVITEAEKDSLSAETVEASK